MLLGYWQILYPQYQISILNDQGNVKYDLEAEKLSLEIVSIISPR